MKKLVLKDVAQKVGVSPSYLSQVRQGCRSPSEDLMLNLKQLGVEMKQIMKHDIDAKTTSSYNESVWQRSSVVEQRTHKPLVVGSNPSAATF